MTLFQNLLSAGRATNRPFNINDCVILSLIAATLSDQAVTEKIDSGHAAPTHWEALYIILL
ncbi:hypothetical protein GGD83_002801 [Rhodoblastus sphagnicola]|uniref:hypothetical protein n=1 Tax=Rhodoblastus sphagnicola TaxID=333368 RepID=UPI000CEBAD9A|nr:hypothetical protein [Rhodoblastus sphagnicola]MBB4198990.1 hypothetical protein [Rhodoblastus sphagnicola]